MLQSLPASSSSSSSSSAAAAAGTLSTQAAAPGLAAEHHPASDEAGASAQAAADAALAASTQAATVPDVLTELEKSSERIPLELIAHGLSLGGAEAASGTTLKLGSIVVEHLINELLVTAKRRKLRDHDSEVILDVPDDAWAAQLAGAGSKAVPVRADVLLERPPAVASPAADGAAARPRGRR